MQKLSPMVYSVVMTAYNSEKYIPECLDSILAQNTASPYEIVVVDNGSTDGTGAICDAYAAEHSCIKVVHLEKNQMHWGGLNTAFRAAKGEYVLAIDSDDLHMPDLLSTLDTLIGQSPDMVVFGSESFDEAGHSAVYTPLILPEGESGGVWVDRLHDAITSFPATIWSYAFKRAFMEEHRLEARPLVGAGDLELVGRALSAAGSITGTDRILYRYRRYSGNSVSNLPPQAFLDQLTVLVQLFRRWPCAYTANYYCLHTAFLYRIGGRKAAKEATRFIRENWDVWDHTTHRYVPLVRVLYKLFGFYYGSAVFLAIRSVKRRVSHESGWQDMKGAK